MKDRSATVAVLRSVVMLAVVQLLPLLVSWRWRWWEAWAYAGVQLGGFAISRAIVATKHPDLLLQRARATQLDDAQPWDKKLVSAMMLLSLLSLAVAGFEARDRVAPVYPIEAKLVALALLVAATAFGSWALVENQFFEGLVRLQKERGHRVVSTGPYAIVRHPGYTGGVLANSVVPLLLDGVWAWLPMAISVALLVRRTWLEDQWLQRELDGYREYTTRTRYRLLPGVW